MDTLAQLAQRVDRDPAAAARDAGDAAAAATAGADWCAASRAHAIRGRAMRMLGEIDLAERALRDAVAAALRQDDRAVEADARLALAGVLSAAGRHDDAFAELDTAWSVAPGPIRRRVDVQRATVLRDVGRYEEALARYADVVPGLRADGPRPTLARVLANRAGIRVHVGDLSGAAADYEEAAGLFRSEGSEFVALNVISDLGCVASHLGDLPRALRHFDEAAAGMAGLGHDASTPMLARADALLLAGLTSDAIVYATDAARRLDASGSGLAAAKARLVVAQAARVEGDPRTALAAAGSAHAAFAAGGADGWARAADVETLRARADLGLTDAEDIASAARLADDCAAAGDVRGEIDATCAGALIAVAAGDVARAVDLLARADAAGASALTAEIVLTIRSTAVTVLVAAGDLQAARHALDAALAASRAAAVSGAGPDTRRDLGPITARLAGAEPDAGTALGWIERERATRRRAATGRDPDDTARFARLRAAATELRAAERDGRPTGAIRDEHAALERELHTRQLRRARSATGHADAGFDLDALGQALGGAAAVSIALDAERARAFVVHDGRTRRVDLGAAQALRTLAAHASRALRGMAGTAANGSVAAARQRVFAAAVGALDEVLDPALAIGAGHVVLTAPPALHTLPWAALAAMRTRSFTLAPSLPWWTDAARHAAPAGDGVAVVAGPRLANAAPEADAVASCHPGAVVLAGADATASATLAALGSHGLVHLVAHGTFRHDNPRWSTIELADGPLTVGELDTLARVPSTVVIATCESATTGSRPGAQVEGIAHALLERGARTVVASIGALPDSDATVETMRSLHAALRAGTPAADALLRARRDGLGATAASLVTLGVGDR